MGLINFRARSGLALTLCCLYTAPALASGTGLREGAADWLANAYVGGSVKAYDAGTAYSNPAGMALLDHSELDGTVSFIAPSAKFSGSNTNPYTGGKTSGVTGGNVVDSAAHGGAFGVLVLSPDIRIGFGITAPFGERVSNAADFVGRYQSLVSSITDINLALAVSYKINDRLSIGGGPTIDYFNTRLTQNLDLGPINAFGDPAADVHGKDIGAGYNIGAIYKIDGAARIGLDYRSRIVHDITGTESVTAPPAYAALGPLGAAVTGNLKALSGPVKTSVTLPDSATAGVYWDIDPRLSVMAEIQWTDWSLFDKVVIAPLSGAPATTLPESWRNTIFAGVGANYRLTEALTLQTGFAYDESPVDDANRTSRIPDADRYILAVGAGYAVTDALKLQLAYGHLFTPGGKISDTSSQGFPLSGTLTGSYADADDSVSMGLNYRF